jgi:N-acetylglutamate synthase-like GNAT family acetyltransferase
MPTEEKIATVLKNYDPADQHLLGCIHDDKLIGVIGIHLDNGNGIINHIAVSSKYRLKNVGQQLTSYAVKQFSLKNIMAETDDDSIGFYQRCGFVCEPFQGKFGKRYICKMDIWSDEELCPKVVF